MACGPMRNGKSKDQHVVIEENVVREIKRRGGTIYSVLYWLIGWETYGAAVHDTWEPIENCDLRDAKYGSRKATCEEQFSEKKCSLGSPCVLLVCK
eukprot:gene28612-35490_t